MTSPGMLRACAVGFVAFGVMSCGGESGSAQTPLTVAANPVPPTSAPMPGDVPSTDGAPIAPPTLQTLWESTTAAPRDGYLVDVVVSGGRCRVPCDRPTRYRLTNATIETSVDPVAAAQAAVPEMTLPPTVAPLGPDVDDELQTLWESTTADSLGETARLANPQCPSLVDGRDISVTVVLRDSTSIVLSNCDVDLSTAGPLVATVLSLVDEASTRTPVAVNTSIAETSAPATDGVGWWFGETVDGMQARVMSRPALPDGRRVLLSVDYETPPGAGLRCIGLDQWAAADWNPEERSLTNGEPVRGLLGPAEIHVEPYENISSVSALALVITLGDSVVVIRTNCGPPPSPYWDRSELTALAQRLVTRPLPGS
jgi:hypothetical protein